MGMQSIIDWLDQTNGRVKNLIFTSSSSVYPQTDGSLVNEESENYEVSERGKIFLMEKGLSAGIGKIGNP